eukprot:CAMPEP_0195522930 /NCGR_PEP_ID=MMETSP0794_2-20130614/21589_1 /TAXON_ID=515487 /ORGANISM="Stephanopyxis turris, Strain CCMP 815" /LENGTH=360 /DNA_ID=CAMNT_0040652807 /DNA_START=80 /DNA_END=1162 /DNA_ORIENTATION=+
MHQMNSKIHAFKLPLVDFTSFSLSSRGDVTEQMKLQTAQAIHEANRQHGFVCLRNSGIPKQSIQAAFSASEKLFDLHSDEKQDLKPIDPMSNTGYVGYGVEALNRSRATDLKEAFNVRNSSFANQDLQGTPIEFREATLELWTILKKLSNEYATCCAMALDLEQNYFSDTLRNMDLCTLRLLHYPPCDVSHQTPHDPEEAEKCAIRVGEHTDFGIFTFLFVNDYHDESSLGLQVKAVNGGEVQQDSPLSNNSEWNNIVFDQEALDLIEQDDTAAVIVNTGALMARWTNDVWRATAHRVIVSSNAYSSHRYSIAMFVDPDKDAVCSVHPQFVNDDEVPKYPPIKSIDYLLMKLREAQGVSE